MKPGRQELDPDPITLAMVLLAALSSVAASANVAIQLLRRREERRERRWAVPRRLFFALDADLERLIAQGRILGAFLDSHGVPASSALSIGQASILLDNESRAALDRLLRDSLKVVRETHKDGTELSAWLQAMPNHEEVAVNLQNAVNKVNGLRYVETYEQFLEGLASQAAALKQGFARLSELYELE